MAELLTSAFESTCIADANPCASVGFSSVSVNLIVGASFGLAATPDVLPAVNVVSLPPSTQTCFTVKVTPVPIAAFNLADISAVFEV